MSSVLPCAVFHSRYDTFVLDTLVVLGQPLHQLHKMLQGPPSGLVGTTYLKRLAQISQDWKKLREHMYVWSLCLFQPSDTSDKMTHLATMEIFTEKGRTLCLNACVCMYVLRM